MIIFEFKRVLQFDFKYFMIAYKLAVMDRGVMGNGEFTGYALKRTTGVILGYINS